MKINEILNWKNKIEEKESRLLNGLIDSKIMTSKEELDFITNRLKQIDYSKIKIYHMN